jgi:hypothetical protein
MQKIWTISVLAFGATLISINNFSLLCSFSDVVLLLGLVKFAQSIMKCVKLDGSMNMHARDVTIERFTNDHDCKVYTTLPHDMDLNVSS